MLGLQLPERRLQLLLRMGAEGSRLAFENDCPVRVAGRHLKLLFRVVGVVRGRSPCTPCCPRPVLVVASRCGQCCSRGSSRFSFSMSVVRFKFSSFAAWRLLPRVRSSDCLMSDNSTFET